MHVCECMMEAMEREHDRESAKERNINHVKSVINKISIHSCTDKAKKISDCRELVRSTLDDIEFSSKPSCPEMSSSY
jgi:hypothetical protein